MNRRDFLKGILAAGCAPAIVRAESLMKIYVPPEKKIVITNVSPWEIAMNDDTYGLGPDPFNVMQVPRDPGKTILPWRKDDRIVFADEMGRILAEKVDGDIGAQLLDGSERLTIDFQEAFRREVVEKFENSQAMHRAQTDLLLYGNAGVKIEVK